MENNYTFHIFPLKRAGEHQVYVRWAGGNWLSMILWLVLMIVGEINDRMTRLFRDPGSYELVWVTSTTCTCSDLQAPGRLAWGLTAYHFCSESLSFYGQHSIVACMRSLLLTVGRMVCRTNNLAHLSGVSAGTPCCSDQMTSSTMPLIRSAAMLSQGVAWRFTSPCMHMNDTRLLGSLSLSLSISIHCFTWKCRNSENN